MPWAIICLVDEKQHRERESNDRVGWYHKTDFKITASIDGEDFNYEGRFDIGDGEGDLLDHIKNFYDYALSPRGESLYKDSKEDLLHGRNVLVPFLEQNTELTTEDEKLLAEIMAMENEWFADISEEAELPEEAQAVTDRLNVAEELTPQAEQPEDALIGTEITIDNRKYIIESIGKLSGDVSMRDITFQNEVGFPINRLEKIGYVQRLLEQEQIEARRVSCWQCYR